MGAVLFMAVLLAIEVGLAVWSPGPITIGGVVLLAVLVLINVLMWRDRR